MSHSHLINHAIGWLEGCLSASFDNVIIDAETLHARAAMPKPISFTDDDLASKPILATPTGGRFFGSPHTMSRCENTTWRPLLADWPDFKNLCDAGAKDATIRAAEVWARTRSSTESLALAPAIDEALGAYALAHKEDICS